MNPLVIPLLLLAGWVVVTWLTWLYVNRNPNTAADEAAIAAFTYGYERGVERGYSECVRERDAELSHERRYREVVAENAYEHGKTDGYIAARKELGL
jgi:hypothetical protein